MLLHRATGLFHVGHEGRPDPLYPQPGMEFINIYLVMHDLAELNQDVQLSSEEKVQILVNKYEEEVSWAEPVDYKWYLEMNAHHMDEMLAGWVEYTRGVSFSQSFLTFAVRYISLAQEKKTSKFSLKVMEYVN